jgi:hypothetical protein
LKGGEPVPLQAGHFSSFGFDLMGFMGCFSIFMADEIRRLDARVSVAADLAARQDASVLLLGSAEIASWLNWV